MTGLGSPVNKFPIFHTDDKFVKRAFVDNVLGRSILNVLTKCYSVV